MSTMHRFMLWLPVPPDENDRPVHHMALHREKRKYQRQAWITACEQARPLMEPPQYVTVEAVFHLWNKRDEDNLVGGLKWALDALRQKQQGNLRWRAGVAHECGYFVDDNPRHLSLGTVSQVIDRERQRLQLVITGGGAPLSK